MPALATFAAVTGSLKTAADTVKAMISLRDAAALQTMAVELREQIISAQSDALAAYEAQTANLQRIRELEEKVANFETWKTEEQRYDLKNLGWGVLAYMLKPDARGTKPPHWVCTNCFGNRRVSIIQYTQIRGHGYRWVCPSCKHEIEPPQESRDGTGAKWLD